MLNYAAIAPRHEVQLGGSLQQVNPECDEASNRSKTAAEDSPTTLKVMLRSTLAHLGGIPRCINQRDIVATKAAWESPFSWSTSWGVWARGSHHYPRSEGDFRSSLGTACLGYLGEFR